MGRDDNSKQRPAKMINLSSFKSFYGMAMKLVIQFHLIASVWLGTVMHIWACYIADLNDNVFLPWFFGILILTILVWFVLCFFCFTTKTILNTSCVSSTILKILCCCNMCKQHTVNCCQVSRCVVRVSNTLHKVIKIKQHDVMEKWNANRCNRKTIRPDISRHAEIIWYLYACIDTKTLHDVSNLMFYYGRSTKCKPWSIFWFSIRLRKLFLSQDVFHFQPEAEWKFSKSCTLS